MRNCLLPLALFSSALCIFAFDDSSGDPFPNAAIVEIDGVKVTLHELEAKRPTSLFQARNAFYQAEQNAMDSFTNDYLLERQAEKEKVTVAQLLEMHVNGAIPKDPSDDLLRVYYEGIQTTQPFEAIRDQILDQIRQHRLAKAKANYIQALRDEAKVFFSVAPPRGIVSIKDAPVRGEKQAAVTIVEYADYECPYCQQVQPVLDKLEAEYKGKIAFAYKDMPLPMHAHAQKSAEAAHCAGAQGKYWEYHDLLFKSKRLEVSQLKEAAGALQLDTKAFDRCLDSDEQAAVVKAQSTEAQSLQLQGTPSFFINGRFFGGGFTYEQVQEIVEEELTLSSPVATHK